MRPLSEPSRFMYDAVMSILMGACHAQAEAVTAAASSSSSTNQNYTVLPKEISGMSHVRGIRRVNFTGASGLVTLEDGVRHSHVSMGVFDLLPPTSKIRNNNPTNDAEEDEEAAATSASSSSSSSTTTRIGRPAYVLTDAYKTIGDLGDVPERKKVEAFTFPDGGKKPPKRLRDEPNQNHLSRGLRIVGFILFAAASVLLLLSAGWVIMNRDHDTIRLAGPNLLLGLCFGAMLENCTILLLSLDEGIDWMTTLTLDRICHVFPWLMTVGQSAIMGILFVTVRAVATSNMQCLKVPRRLTLLLCSLVNSAKADRACT